MYIGVLYVCLYALPGAYGGHIKGSDLLELDLQIVLNCHVDARNRTWSSAKAARGLNC